LKGRYEDALAMMNGVNQESLRVLGFQQYWVAQLGLLRLQHALHRFVRQGANETTTLTPHRDDRVAARHLLLQLRASPSPSRDMSFSVSILEIRLLIRQEDYAAAMQRVDALTSSLGAGDGDIFHRIKLMILKARVYDRAGVPQKGFSVAIRAASLAYKCRILSLLWEAVGALCRVLVSIKEFEAAELLMVGIMPQVLECEDCELAGDSFSFLADAHMGMAGQAKAGTFKRTENMNKALAYLERAFDEYSRVDDVKGQCEMLAKRATIMHLSGDLVLANDLAAKYLDIQRAAREELAS
jgi:anaphase-promoting complex subunit 5